MINGNCERRTLPAIKSALKLREFRIVLAKLGSLLSASEISKECLKYLALLLESHFLPEGLLID